MKIVFYTLLLPFMVIGFLGCLAVHGWNYGWAVYEAFASEVFK